MTVNYEAELTTIAGGIAEENGLDGNQAADLANELAACVDDFLAAAFDDGGDHG